MSKFSRVIVLVVGLMSVFAAMAGAASATTWTNSGDTAFTATTGASSLSTASATLSCTSGSASGTATTPQVSATYTVSGNLSYASCRLGLITTTVNCTYTLTGNSLSAGVTTGTIAVVCRDTVAGCNITGTITGRYTNASASTAGSLAVNGSSGLTSRDCVLSGAAALTPNPDVFTVTAGVGRRVAGLRPGPLLGRTP